MGLKIFAITAFSLIWLAFLPQIASTQIPEEFQPPGSRGRHTINGILFLPDRTPAGRGIQVRLSRGANDASMWTDQDGRFSFANIANSTYTIAIEAGEDYEQIAHRLEVALPPNAPPQSFFVNLQLRYKPSVTPKQRVIDADLANVPAKAIEHLEKAKAAASKGETKASIAELLLAIAEHSDLFAARVLLGVQYLNLGELERSEEHLRFALKLKPNSYEPLANLGIVLSRSGKHPEAESTLLEILKIRNDSPIAYFYLGRSLLAQGKLEPAEVSFKNALAIGGNEMSEAHRSLANIYLQQGENEKAIVEIESYLAKNPEANDRAKLSETIQQIKNRLKPEENK